MLKLPKKLMITLMATATVLGVGTGIGQLPSASARHVRTYRVRRHRTYRHRRAARRLTKRTRRTKRNKRTKRIRYTKRARRSARKYRRYHLVYKATKARRPKRNRRYVRKHAHRRVIHRTPRLQNMFSEFSKAQLQHIAKLDCEPLKEFESDEAANNNNHIYGPAKAYNLDGQIWIFTKPGLAFYAKINKMSVPKLMRTSVEHATKYWTWNGNSTKLATNEANKDAINDLNQEREARGIQPLTQDPDLQFIAEKRSQQITNQVMNPSSDTSSDIHDDANGNSYAQEIANKYGLQVPYGENAIVGGAGGSYQKPSQLARAENDVWQDPGHISNRLNPAWTKVGISTDGPNVEEFA